MRKDKALFFFVIALVISFSGVAHSQIEVLTSPEQTIASLFKSMHDGNSELAEKVFTESASLHSVYTNKAGEQKVEVGEIQKFIESIGSEQEEVWDERVANLSIKVDGDLAQAWMDYSFFVDEKFSHCGVNAMHLIRIEGQWKIFQIVDTRRKSNCN